MASLVDSEKGEESKPLLEDSPLDESISAPEAPGKDKKCRFWRFVVCTFCAAVALHTLSRLRGYNGPTCGRGRGQMYYHSMHCLDSANFTTVAAPENEEGLPYHAHTSIALPAFAEELAFVARGDFSYGTFQISQSEDVGSEAIVDVSILYKRPEVLGNATMCRLHPSEDRWGFGIFTPDWFRAEREEKIKVHIDVRLPASAEPGKPLRMKELRTYLPKYVHAVGDLSESVHFDKVHLTSHEGEIAAKNLRADIIKVEAGVGPIVGEYNATELLVLNTANAPIMVRANLLGGVDGTSRMFLETTNSVIDSQIGLYSNASDGTKGTFQVTARTVNSPLSVAFVDAPVDSTLTAAISTSNSPAQVTLHKTYEGIFSLSSTIFGPTVDWNGDAEDPAGRGRGRTVTVNTVKSSMVTGNVFWGEDDGSYKGSVAVGTSNSPVRLVL